MAPTYDAIADWYEDEFLGDRSDDGLPISDPIGVDSAIGELLGNGVGICLEIGCGTGTHAARIAVWVECPLALTYRPGCCDTLALDFQSFGPMVKHCRFPMSPS